MHLKWQTSAGDSDLRLEGNEMYPGFYQCLANPIQHFLVQIDSLLACQQADLPRRDGRNRQPVLARCEIDGFRRMPSQTRFVERCPEDDMGIEKQKTSCRVNCFRTHFIASHSTSIGEMMSPSISPVPRMEPTKSPSWGTGDNLA